MKTIDLLYAITSVMEESSTALTSYQDGLLFKLMIQFAEEKNLLTRLSVFGLFGDLQKYIEGVAVQLSSELMRQCVTNMVYSESNT